VNKHRGPEYHLFVAALRRMMSIVKRAAILRARIVLDRVFLELKNCLRVSFLGGVCGRWIFSS
jgi:hypothetical protein